MMVTAFPALGVAEPEGEKPSTLLRVLPHRSPQHPLVRLPFLPCTFSVSY